MNRLDEIKKQQDELWNERKKIEKEEWDKELILLNKEYKNTYWEDEYEGIFHIIQLKEDNRMTRETIYLDENNFSYSYDNDDFFSINNFGRDYTKTTKTKWNLAVKEFRKQFEERNGKT